MAICEDKNCHSFGSCITAYKGYRRCLCTNHFIMIEQGKELKLVGEN